MRDFLNNKFQNMFNGTLCFSETLRDLHAAACTVQSFVSSIYKGIAFVPISGQVARCCRSCPKVHVYPFLHVSAPHGLITLFFFCAVPTIVGFREALHRVQPSER